MRSYDLAKNSTLAQTKIYKEILRTWTFLTSSTTALTTIIVFASSNLLIHGGYVFCFYFSIVSHAISYSCLGDASCFMLVLYRNISVWSLNYSSVVM